MKFSDIKINTVSLFFVSYLCCLAGCVDYTGRQSPAPVHRSSQDQGVNERDNPYAKTTPYQVDDQPVEAVPYQGPKTARTPEPRKTTPSSPAVVALVSEADRNYKAGNLESAVATIERALRIEPRNAKLVYKLAALRLKQNKPYLAEDLAKKAALLATGDLVIKKQSWLLIAEARRIYGDNYGANEARKKASKY